MAYKNHIHNLESLEKEISRQKSKARKMEKELDNQAGYFQHHFFRLLKNSVIRPKTAGETVAENLVMGFFRNEKIQELMEKFAEWLAEKTASLVDSLMERLFRK